MLIYYLLFQAYQGGKQVSKAGGKYRRRNSGVKLSRSVIENLKPVLLEIGSWPEVKQVTPSVISHIRGNGSELKICIKRVEISGFLCAAKRGPNRQEFFVTTSNRAVVEAKLKQLACYL